MLRRPDRLRPSRRLPSVPLPTAPRPSAPSPSSLIRCLSGTRARRVSLVALASALGSLAPLAVPAPLGLGVDLSAQRDAAATSVDYSTVAQTRTDVSAPGLGAVALPLPHPSLVLAAGPTSAAVPATFLRPGAIPGSALAAYRSSAAAMAVERPQCHLSWQVLAGIGLVESDHGSMGGSGQPGWSGLAQPAIYGPVLDGSSGAAMRDTDGGALDGDPTWDRAVGPMQFLPSTWVAYASDGNGDGVADPQQIADAALTAASFLCSRGTDLADPQNLASAIFGYNHAGWYVSQVLAAAQAYGAAGLSVVGPGVTPPSTNGAVTAPVALAAAPTVIGNPPARSNPGGPVGSVLTYAYGQLGTPYVWGGTTEDGFDCSGLTQASYAAAGFSLPRTAAQQWSALSKVSANDLQAGDLVFFATGRLGPGVASHVGIYLGNGYMLDAPHPGAVVRIEPVYQVPGYLGAARPSGVPQLPDAVKDHSDKPASDKPASDKPSSPSPSGHSPSTDKPSSAKPAGDKSSTDKPGTGKPSTDQPGDVADGPATDSSATPETGSAKPGKGNGKGNGKQPPATQSPTPGQTPAPSQTPTADGTPSSSGSQTGTSPSSPSTRGTTGSDTTTEQPTPSTTPSTTPSATQPTPEDASPSTPSATTPSATTPSGTTPSGTTTTPGATRGNATWKLTARTDTGSIELTIATSSDASAYWATAPTDIGSGSTGSDSTGSDSTGSDSTGLAEMVLSQLPPGLAAGQVVHLSAPDGTSTDYVLEDSAAAPHVGDVLLSIGQQRKLLRAATAH
ncbi:MAG: NlpC/P60 family protein [Actinomycetes bacterium]